MSFELSERELIFLAMLCERQAERVPEEANRQDIRELAARLRAAYAERRAA